MTRGVALASEKGLSLMTASIRVSEANFLSFHQRRSRARSTERQALRRGGMEISNRRADAAR